MKVATIRGEVDMEQLGITDVVEVGDNHRKIATEYRLEGELVRRDVVVNVLRPLMADAFAGNMNG